MIPQFVTHLAIVSLISALSISCATVKVTTFTTLQIQNTSHRDDLVRKMDSIFVDELGFTKFTIPWTSSNYNNPDATYTKKQNNGTMVGGVVISEKKIIVSCRIPSTLSEDPDSQRIREILTQRLIETFDSNIEISEDEVLLIFTGT